MQVPACPGVHTTHGMQRTRVSQEVTELDGNRERGRSQVVRLGGVALFRATGSEIEWSRRAWKKFPNREWSARTQTASDWQ